MAGAQAAAGAMALESERERGGSVAIGVTAIAGAVLMLIGAALWAASGADLDAALADGAIPRYLTDAAANSELLVANLSFWIAGVLMLSIGGLMLLSLGVPNSNAAIAARAVYTTGAPLAIASFVAWLALIRLAGSGGAEVEALADTLGFFASRADWIATVLLVSVGPALIVASGRDSWVPGWLAAWGALALFAGLLSTVAMFAGGLTTYGFLVVPVGLGWTIAAGVVALRGPRGAAAR